jgi:protein TonB
MLLVKATGSGVAVAEQTGNATNSNPPIPIIMATNLFAVRFIALPLPQASSHFLMIRTDYRLFAALALSLSLHLLAFLLGAFSRSSAPPAAAPLQAELRLPPPAESVSSPPLQLPEPAPKASASPRQQPAQSKAEAPKTWTQAVREQLKKLDAAGQFYPAEAIAKGLEGEVQVLLIIDESGQVVAARVEQGSGHPILDEAALRAARTLKSLPTDAPRQTVLPVRFRLR